MLVEFHPLAEQEAVDAHAWYRARSPRTAQRFTETVNAAIEKVAAETLWGSPFFHGTRRIRVRRFPYSIVYYVLSDRVLVVAIAHSSRRVDYWRNRIAPDL